MGSPNFAKISSLFIAIFSLSLFPNLGHATRKLTALYQPPPMALSYHNGDLLQGNLPVSIIWYGEFTTPQKSVISDFFLSLNHNNNNRPVSRQQPTVSNWWQLIQTYLKKAGKKPAQIVLSAQFFDRNCSSGKILKRNQIEELAKKAINSNPDGLTLVLTSKEVAVEGFCMSNCGFHGSTGYKPKPKSAFIWVGNSESQCPGQCAWPFHKPIYGPQTEPLVSPNGDVGVDGMVINIASLLAGTVTNPFGNGFYLGRSEAAAACTGVYGKGAYPGYAGEVLVDPVSGGSYNAAGINGRKYLLPALFDPLTSHCSTVAV